MTLLSEVNSVLEARYCGFIFSDTFQFLQENRFWKKDCLKSRQCVVSERMHSPLETLYIKPSPLWLIWISPCTHLLRLGSCLRPLQSPTQAIIWWYCLLIVFYYWFSIKIIYESSCILRVLCMLPNRWFFLFSGKHEESLMGQSHDFVHPSSCGCLTPEALPVLACFAG